MTSSAAALFPLSVPPRRTAAHPRLASVPRRVAAMVLACTLAAGLSACSQDEGAQDAAVAGEGSAPLEVDAAKLTLVTPGEGDKRVLAYRAPAGEAPQTQEGKLRLAQGFTQGIGDASTSPLPAQESEVTGLSVPYTARTVHAEDTRMVTLTLGQGRFDDLSRAGDVVAAADGFSMAMAVADTGQVRTVSLSAPQDATDAGRAVVESLLMAQLATPVVFPAEPIGVGAVWELDSRVPGSNALLQHTTLTLTALEGDRAEVDVTLTQRPTQSALDLGSVGREGELKVLSSETLSRGSLTVDLSQPLPTSGSIEAITRVIYGEDTPDATQRVVQDTSFLVDYAPQPTAG
ncbi:hypothetical protein C1Y63_07895 [Corynebacterium sp. 13CS0277]|uniref:hypothetical protein n=1 Tax=Corynebacterium sp. 13CS0277 TaxID=2071994 RepID=UPI000D44A1C9|nr:hypothetical protein [Corynebacterium sp. 13CS0277]PRQ11165.1 hypothetical protein C1Y63_07895 [Corynebacterium sp. 13CS0277]